MITNTTPNLNKAKTSTSFFSRTKKKPEYTEAVEEVKKLYQKYYASPNPLLMSQIKTSKINIYLNNFNFNDISVINKILSKYFYFEYLTLSPYDPNKKNPDSITKRNAREPITEGEKVKMEKEKHDAEIERNHLINKVTSGVGKHLALSNRLLSFSLINFPLEANLAEHLSKGIIENKSIQGLYVNNCQMSIESYEILLKGLLNHEKIEFLDLSNNNLQDKYGNMISRIIARQTYRRDQVIWLYGLRNEFPLNNDYTRGLISINLRSNNLSSYSADCITTSLASDQYVRYIDLSQNNFNNDACKQFIHMLRQNVTLLNIDLRENPGYDENIHTRIVMKMSKNIRHLYQQFQDGVYSDIEFENFKQFIDTSFFDLDIPQEIVDYYNNNLLQTTDNNNVNNNNANNNLVVTKAMSDIKENDENEEDEEEEGAVRNNDSKTMNTTKKSKSIKNNEEKDKSLKSTKPKKDNKKLMQENLLLKQQIIELKAKNIQSQLGKNINVPKKYNPKRLEKNYKVAEDLLNKLNQVMDDMKNQSKSDVMQEKEEKNDEKNKTKNFEKKTNKENSEKKEIEKKEEIPKKEETPKKQEIPKKGEEKKVDKNEIKENEQKNNKQIQEDEEDEDLNFDNLTDEQKIQLIQQNEILRKLQEAAEARGEKFDIQDYIAFLEEHNREEEEENDDDGHF